MMVELGKNSEETGFSFRGKEILSVSSYSPTTCHKSKDEAPAPTYYEYPPPLQKYDVIVSNPKVFIETLKNLHATMGTKFMIPIIGGNDLDMHRLFVEVTSRGGIEKVIRERRWKEVTAAFSFPSTATNASFVLRKYYITLIYHYEQIYFFGAKGYTSTTTIDFLSSSRMPNPSQCLLPSSDFLATSTHKRKRSTEKEIVSEVAVCSSSSCHVVGVINGKFEHGYLVTVTVGMEKLSGVLYHVPQHLTSQALQYSNTLIDKDTKTLITRRRRRRRKKSEMKKRDPDHPKPNRSGYNFFFQEQHARLKPLHPGKDREISRMIGELWNKLGDPGKSVYQEKGLKDKERYKSEMEEYRERLKSNVDNNLVPIQQRSVMPEVYMEDIDSQMEGDEGDFAQSLEHDTSTSYSESEKEKTSEKDYDISINVGNNGINIDNVALQPVIEGENIELQKGEKFEDGVDV